MGGAREGENVTSSLLQLPNYRMTGDIIKPFAVEARGLREPAPYHETQGFVTEDGTFLTRAEAEKLARQTGQLVGPIIGGELTSEDLW